MTPVYNNITPEYNRYVTPVYNNITPEYNRYVTPVYNTLDLTACSAAYALFSAKSLRENTF